MALQVKESACRRQRAVAAGWLTGNSALTRELPADTMERILKKILREGNSSQIVAVDVVYSQSAVSKNLRRHKQSGRVVKGKRTGRPKNTSKCQDRKLQAMCLENRKSTAKEIKKKQRAEMGDSVCDWTVWHWLKEIKFASEKPNGTHHWHLNRWWYWHRDYILKRWLRLVDKTDK